MQKEDANQKMGNRKNRSSEIRDPKEILIINNVSCLSLKRKMLEFMICQKLYGCYNILCGYLEEKVNYLIDHFFL